MSFAVVFRCVGRPFDAIRVATFGVSRELCTFQNGDAWVGGIWCVYPVYGSGLRMGKLQTTFGSHGSGNTPSKFEGIRGHFWQSQGSLQVCSGY